MNEFPDITIIAKALSNSSKMKILDELMDYKGHTATELARASQITPQTVTHHLNEFLNNNWIRMEKSGRFHYFFLTNTDVAQLLEQLSPISPQKRARSLQRTLDLEKDELFRTCYDHMAGHIGVLIAQSLVTKKYLDSEFHPTELGITFLKDTLNIDTQNLHNLKRQFTTQCLDWSERQHHVGGALGHALFLSFAKNKFVVSHKSIKRALVVTSTGDAFLQEKLNIKL
ncbi:ArsR/SmtB family transcription factor [Liquorilactobacillus sp.]|uniref:ArsR/SmtB family transcription factor n=1 Tax=Liquorilactobacillus sp. TaxID=2767923 RepID=UPI0039EABFE3